MIAQGQIFPDFELPDENGTSKSIDQLLENGPAVIFFYPKDNTKICTKEACEFRDTYTEFNALNASVVGISNDNQTSHKTFISRYQLNFPLLTDKNGNLRKKIGIENSLFGLIAGRVTFVVNKNKTIVHITNSQWGSSVHIRNAIKALEDID